MHAQPWRVGIVGAGFGARVHAPAFAAHPAFQLVGIASPHSAEQVAKNLGIGGYSNIEAMLGQVELDILSIAGPPALHHSATLLGFQHGLHVLCEKPFALRLHEAEEMATAAKKAQRIGALCHEFRFFSARQAISQLIRNQHLGPLRQIEITQMQPFLRADGTRKRSWWFEREAGGGVTGAWFSHVADMACWLAGRPPERIFGLGRTANPRRHDADGEFTSSVEDGVFALLDFGDGLIARLTVDATAAVESFICAVHGETRTVIASGTNLQHEKLYTIDDEETSELELLPSAYAHLGAAEPLLPAFMDMLTALNERLQGKPSEIADFDDGVITQRILASTGYGR